MKVKETTINATRVSLTAYYDDYAVTREIPTAQLKAEYPEWEVKEFTDVEAPAEDCANSEALSSLIIAYHRPKSAPRKTTTAIIVITQPK